MKKIFCIFRVDNYIEKSAYLQIKLKMLNLGSLCHMHFSQPSLEPNQQVIYFLIYIAGEMYLMVNKKCVETSVSIFTKLGYMHLLLSNKIYFFLSLKVGKYVRKILDMEVKQNHVCHN